MTGVVQCSNRSIPFLAADCKRQTSLAVQTLSQKTRVGVFCAPSSGRLDRRGRRRAAMATGSRACGYKTASGRSKWLSRDPIGEQVFKLWAGQQNSNRLEQNDLYRFVANDPLNKLDPDGLDTWVPYPPPGHYVSDPQPQPQYPEGFAMCQRDVAVEGPSDIVAQCCNSFGGQHTYLQYVSTPQPPAQGPPFVWGWGFSGGTRTAPELHFDPSFCKPCTKNGSALKYGSGMGKSSKDASDTEIRDCIMNRKPTRPYSFPRYVCSDWAKEAASDCGLTCR